MEDESQGAKANRHGRHLEKQVEKHLNSLGVVSVKHRDWVAGIVEAPENATGVLLKDVPYVTFSGKNGKSEYLLLKNGKLDTRIECRGQYSKGSVDDKLAALHLNALAFKERQVVLVVDGDGFHHTMVPWLKKACASDSHKKILVATFEEFKEWAKIYFNVTQEKENENEETLNNGRQEQDQQSNCNERQHGYPVNRQGARPNRPNRKLIIGTA